MRTDKRSVMRQCLGGCGRSVQGPKKRRCVYCKVTHTKALRQVARDQRRALRLAPVDRDIPDWQIERLLAAGDAEIRRLPAVSSHGGRMIDRYRQVLARYRETSRRAHESIAAHLPFVDAGIVSVIESQGGATSDEVERATQMKHQTVSAQIRHLYEGGILCASGDTRPTQSGRQAIVWVLSTDAKPGPPSVLGSAFLSPGEFIVGKTPKAPVEDVPDEGNLF